MYNIKEMQIKITIKYFIPTRVARQIIILRASVGENVKKLGLQYNSIKHVKCLNHCGKILLILQIFKQFHP